MITSSQFFEKSFFTFDTGDERIQADEVSPWGVIPPRASLNQKQIVSPSIIKKKPNNNNRGYQLSRNSSLKYIQKKLKAKSDLNPSRDLHTIQQYKQYSTLQQNLPHIPTKFTKYAESIEIITRVKRPKKKSNIFPEITINQYNDIKAKGNSLLGGNPVQQILQRRKNRRKILQQFGKSSSKQSINKQKKQNKTKSTQGRAVLSGRYVCIAKSPQFSVNGQPTTKLLDQY